MVSATETLRYVLDRYPRVRKIARQLIASVPLSLRLGKHFWEWYAFYEESEQWSLSQLTDYQMECLRSLLTQLSRTSKFYGERLAAVDIESLETLEQLKVQVPVLSRPEFRENYAEIRSSLWRQQKLVKSQTSGTTGMALQFYHPAEDTAREWGAICHQWKRVGYVPGKSRRAEFRGLTPPRKMVEDFPHLNMIRCSILHLREEHVRQYADAIRDHQADFYHGYPSALYLLAKEICECGIDFPQPTAILLASEGVYDWQVAQIQTAFPNAKLFAHYGCAERTVLAGWCEDRREYHVLPQYALVEVDDATREVIGTNLLNSVNGFVRYRMTDTVLEAKWDRCPDCCRAYTPRLVELGGRSEDYLYSPQTGWIPPAIVTYPLKALHQIREIQFRQEDRNEVAITYTLVAQPDNSKLMSELEQIEIGMHRLFGTGMRFRFERVDGFSRDPSGTFKWIVCGLDGPPRK